MKCNFCNASLKMADDRCPYCGAPNPHFKEEKEKVEQLKEEFKTRKNKVSHHVSETKRKERAKMIVIVLVVLNLSLYGCYDTVTNWGTNILYHTIAGDQEIHNEVLDTALMQQDYMAVYTYYSNQKLARVDAFDAYGNIFKMCSLYAEVYTETMELVLPRSKYFDAEFYYKYLSRDILSFYEEKENALRYYTDEELEMYLNIEEKIENLLYVYFDIPSEVTESFIEMTEEEIREYIEKGDSLNENNQDSL